MIYSRLIKIEMIILSFQFLLLCPGSAQTLKSSDHSVKVAAFKSAAENPMSVTIEDLPIIIEGLSSSDDAIKKNSSAALWGIAFVSKSNSQTKLSLDKVLGFPNLHGSLLKAAEDKLDAVRMHSYYALLLLYPQDASIFKLVVKNFKEEPSHKVRSVMIQNLSAADLKSPEMIQLSIEALSDQNSEVRGYAAKNIALLKPPLEQVFSKLLDCLNDNDAFTQENAAKAIASYGMEAAKYIQQIKNIISKLPPESSVNPILAPLLNEQIKTH